MKKLLAILAINFAMGIHVNAQTDESIESKIDDIISQLTLDEKVAMCHAQSKFSSPGVPRLGIPELWMSDGPHGVRAEINWDNWGYAGWTNDSITAFPALTALAATFDPDLSGQYGVAVGEEARYRKKDVLLGPGVNIYRTPLNGRNFEYMGEDPLLASEMVVPYVQGVQSNGVAACVKHYVLNNQEHWRSDVNVTISDRALYEIYLPAFKAAVQEGKTWSIMGAYNKYEGQYCSHNEKLNNKILKGEWGFDGVIITDWGAARDTKQAALYGLDIEMGTGTDGMTYSLANAYDNYYLAFPFRDMIKSGEVDESYVDDKVRRILRLMFRTNMNPNKPLGSVNTKAHHDVARKIGQEAVVLLKNENNFFPLDPDQKMTIAIIGENATRPMGPGGGSSELKPQFEVSVLEGLEQRFKNSEVIYSLGYSSGPPVWGRVAPSPYDADSLRNAAIAIAKKADVVLFVGGLNKNFREDCEGGDRLKYELSFGQNELIEALAEANPNLGVIMVSGNAYATPWLSKTKALLQGWYLGSMAGHALADVISGDVNPSGKLPFTFPKKLADNAAHSFGSESYPGINMEQTYKEDILVGYRWHETKKILPQFPFGFGLSYTDFELTNIVTDQKKYSKEDQITVNFDVSNKGNMDGAEVVQVYIGKPKSKVARAKKELKGFSKNFVQRGNSIDGKIEIPVSSLAYYDEANSDWVIESGQYEVFVGNASNNISKTLKITIE